MNIIIRAEKPDERPVTTEIVRQAYGRENEVRIAEALRASAEFNPNLSIVADLDGDILGYALYFRTKFECAGSAHPTLALGPIAVRPDSRGKGVGERLVRHGLERCRTVGVDLIFVVGLPQYFSRFGFKPAAPKGIKPGNFSVPETDFQVIDLGGRLLGKVQGTLSYPQAFFQK